MPGDITGPASSGGAGSRAASAGGRGRGDDRNYDGGESAGSGSDGEGDGGGDSEEDVMAMTVGPKGEPLSYADRLKMLVQRGSPEARAEKLKQV